MSMIRKSVPYILIVSLALNLILIGFIVGEKRAFIGGPGGPRPPATMRYVIQSLPMKTRMELFKSMRGELRNIEKRREINDLFGAVLVQSLSTGEFDREKFETAMKNVQVIMTGVHNTMTERLLDVFENMTPEERIEFAQKLKEKIDEQSVEGLRY